MRLSNRKNVDFWNSIPAVAAARTTSVNGTGVDLKNFREAAFLLHYIALTDGTYTFDFQHSDDNSAWSSVAATDLDGSVPPAWAGSGPAWIFARTGYLGGKRYVRGVCTVTGSPSTGARFGLYIMRAQPIRGPIGILPQGGGNYDVASPDTLYD